jgi:hypothetical protein
MSSEARRIVSQFTSMPSVPLRFEYALRATPNRREYVALRNLHRIGAGRLDRSTGALIGVDGLWGLAVRSSHVRLRDFRVHCIAPQHT